MLGHNLLWFVALFHIFLILLGQFADFLLLHSFCMLFYRFGRRFITWFSRWTLRILSGLLSLIGGLWRILLLCLLLDEFQEVRPFELFKFKCFYKLNTNFLCLRIFNDCVLISRSAQRSTRMKSLPDRVFEITRVQGFESRRFSALFLDCGRLRFKFLFFCLLLQLRDLWRLLDLGSLSCLLRWLFIWLISVLRESRRVQIRRV